MKLLTVSEATVKANDFLKEPITEKCVYSWVYRGKVPHIKIGSAVMIMDSELEKFLSGNRSSAKQLGNIDDPEEEKK